MQIEAEVYLGSYQTSLETRYDAPRDLCFESGMRNDSHRVSEDIFSSAVKGSHRAEKTDFKK